MDISLSRLTSLPEPLERAKDPFFEPASLHLIFAVKEFASLCAYPDLITCQLLLDQENLIVRLQRQSMPEQVRLKLGPLQIMCSSPKTLIAIETTAQHRFQQILEILKIEPVSTDLDCRQLEIERLFSR